jgi:hypothetical protein
VVTQNLKSYRNENAVFLDPVKKGNDDFQMKVKKLLSKHNKRVDIGLNIYGSGTPNQYNTFVTTIVRPLLKKLETDQEKNSTATKEYNCELDYLNKLVYNCGLRRNEGYMINKSLADLRIDIRQLIKKSLEIGNSGILPIYYEKEIFPYCKNTYLDDVGQFKYFYDYQKSDHTKLSGILLNIMQTKPDQTQILGFGLDMSKINFIVFTVLNTTDNTKVNNPPNPPYININPLIYLTSLYFNSDQREKLIIELMSILLELEKYTFYQNNIKINDVRNDTIKIINEKYQIKENIGTKQLITYSEAIIKEIETNNAATLIGSIEGTDKIQNTAYDKVSCSYNENLDYIAERFKGTHLNPWTTDNIKSINIINSILDDDAQNFEVQNINNIVKGRNINAESWIIQKEKRNKRILELIKNKNKT